jgi:hypothetical protein
MRGGDGALLRSDAVYETGAFSSGDFEEISTAIDNIDGKNDDAYFFYLNKGFHLAPSAGGDNHKRTWGRSI